MDLLTIILACSLHPDDRLVEAFVRKVSDANSLLVGDFVTLETHDDLRSVDEALDLAEELVRKGGRPGLGLMAIPMSWAARFNREPRDLLDGCTNISIGTAMMAAFAAKCDVPTRAGRKGQAPRHRWRPPTSAAQRECVMRGFEREIGVQGFSKIVSEISRLPAMDADADPPPERSNVFEEVAPAARPQAPLELPPAPIGGGPSPGPQAPPRRDPATPATTTIQPRALGTRPATGPPPNRLAPSATRPAAEERTPATPPARRAPPPILPLPPTVVRPGLR
jgi:hypothetical protein